MSNKAAVDFVWKQMIDEGVTPDTITPDIAHKISQALVQQAYERMSGDNISATIVFFNKEADISTTHQSTTVDTNSRCEKE